MKKVIILLSFVTLVSFVNAQQAPTAAMVKKASPVMKVNATKPVPASNIPVVKNTEATKTCCQGKSAAECSHGKKECTKGEAKAAACCQKSGTGKTCNHAELGKAAETK